MKNNNIIVLGGSGFLGSHIIEALQKKITKNVVCGDFIHNKFIDCKFVKLNILDREEIRCKLKDYDIIINCIGQITNPFDQCFKLNSIGINNLCSVLSINKARLIQISTIAVYGSLKKCNEKSSVNPETNYATAKAFAEQILLDNNLNDNLTILRLSNLYGSHQLKGVFAYLLKSYFTDRILEFNNNGNLIRSFMHVEDCADIIIEVVKNNQINGIYNVKGHETYSIVKLIEEFENRFSVEFEKKFSNTLPWENILSLEDSKLRSKIDLQPKWSVFDYIENELKREKK